MRKETKIGVMLPQAKDCLEPLEVGNGEKRLSPGDFRGSRFC